jgi:catechol 2,3-dioxygenase-like lactoylglutathione lyase family enzyme
MSDEAYVAATAEKRERDFTVPMMFHPSHDVLDLREAEQFYERVFGRESTLLGDMMLKLPVQPGREYPRDYSTFTPMCDVLFDTIDPDRYVLDGVQKLPSITEPHLRLIAFYVDGMDQAVRDFHRHGIHVVSQMGEIIEEDVVPTAYASDILIFYTLPEDTGLRYALERAGFFRADERIDVGWEVPPVSEHDPLQLQRCSHHTILTKHPNRALKFFVDILGADVFHEGRDHLLGASSTYIFLGDSALEIAVPDEGTPAYQDWKRDAPNDTYHALTWKVADLRSVRKHLEQQQVKLRTDTDDAIITDPATSLGIPWGFTTKLVPGDPRHE